MEFRVVKQIGLAARMSKKQLGLQVLNLEYVSCRKGLETFHFELNT